MVCDWSLAALLLSSDRSGVQRAVKAMCLKMLNLFLLDPVSMVKKAMWSTEQDNRSDRTAEGKKY